MEIHPVVIGVKGSLPRFAGETTMLSFEQQAAFEEWLQQCPLDPHSLTYSVSRKGGASLSVQLCWEVLPRAPAAAPHAPEHRSLPPARPSPQSAPPEDTATEIVTTRAKLAQLQNMISSATQGSGASSGGTDGLSGAAGAAMAAALLNRAKDGATDTSAEAVRAMLGQMGMTLPKAPGMPFGGPSATSPMSKDDDESRK
jgi:hypothetical protein